ncbi:uncharacterized protein SOCEGT47_062690 [Sorangium cellulosum]|uniref:DUF2169 domain-containing protein n=2 Tax=Sorangium cellulosum TaxID=56 RepID=A0A4P2Q894_SORCE|nr:uncharacterized protein SOCEGT47_062690 [Sorangium cellulosum]
MVWRFRGELRVTAIVKATFAFAQNTAMPRVAPQEIFRAEIHHGALPSRSVRFTTDRVPRLLQADVVATGHAHAPHGRPLETLPVRLGLFAGGRTLLDKTLIVRKRGGFVRLPLDYEHAFGGLGFPDNPFGAGYRGAGEPNLLDPFDPARVAGFGPIAQAMPARKRLLGAIPRALLEREIAEIPDELCWDYFQAAPADQRPPFLRGDEWIVMDGLHPSAPRLRMRLPGARGLARVEGLSDAGIDEREVLPLCADMLRIDGDEQRCTVTWRGSFPVPHEGALARIHVLAGVELPGEPIAWPAPGAATGRAGASAPGAHPVTHAGTAPRRGVEAADGDEDDAALASTLAMAPCAAGARHDGTLDLPEGGGRALVESLLPFRSAPEGPSPPRRSAPALPEAPPLRRSGTEALPRDAIERATRQPVVPFSAAAALAPPAAAAPAPPAAAAPAPPAAAAPSPPAAAAPSPPAAAAPAPPDASAPAPPAAAPPAAPRAFAWATPPPEPPPPPGAPERPAKLDVKALLYGPGKKPG